jgi:hypothetical protein
MTSQLVKRIIKIAIRLQSPTSGYFAYNWFFNNTTGVVVTPYSQVGQRLQRFPDLFHYGSNERQHRYNPGK